MTREPEWDEDERAWMLALATREAAECRRCGGDLVETTDHEHNRYVPDKPIVCLRCLALHQSEKTHEKNAENVAMIHRAIRQDRRKTKGASGG